MSRLVSLAHGVGAFVMTLSFAPIAAPAQGKIEYRSVAEARKALSAKPGATAREEEGRWVVVAEPNIQTQWSFTPEGHEAHPAVVKRAIVRKGDDIFIDMDILCEATKPACDRLAESFQALNAQVKRDLKGGR